LFISFIIIIGIGDEMERKTCLNDVVLTLNKDNLIIQREKGFLSLSNSVRGGSIRMVKSIININQPFAEKSSDEQIKEEYMVLKSFFDANNDLKPAEIIFGDFDLKKCVNITVDGVTAIIFAGEGDDLNLNVLVILKDELDEKTLLEAFKAAVEAKCAALWDFGIINGFSLDLFASGNEDSILVACSNGGGAISSHDRAELRLIVGESVRKGTKLLLEKYGYPNDIIGHMEDVGVHIEDLVDAGMQLCVGVEKTEELNHKLRNQLFKSLEDLNVVSLIMAGIRLEEDFNKHRMKGVDVDDDPAYLYTDEVLGMAVANQIAGTKAIFNFKRYDEEKPGIIITLGPFLDDVFAGLVAGCMSKIFEE
jgi:alpha-ribazole phosphatase CobZ